MSKMWDIAQYVEANPDHHDQRWRLCKKLYHVKEYRLALEHLLILKNHWEDRKRVRRYLAATYYRMEQYKDAIKELKEAISLWPEEVPLYEQLAQVQYKSELLDDCAETWNKIAELDPKHKYAGKAAKAIKAEARGEEYDQFDTDALGAEMDQGFGMSVEVTCPQCNAKNSDEFERCWNCHAPLSGMGPVSTPTPVPGTSPYKSMLTDDEEEGERGNTIWILLAGAGFVALFCLYQMFSLLLQDTPTGPAMTLQELLQFHITGSRIWVGAILLVVWTFLLAISVDLFFKERPTRIPEALCAGFIVGGISYGLMALPLSQLPFAFLIPGALALPLMFWILPKKPGKILAAWALHLALVFVFMYVCVMIVERSVTGQWFSPIKEYNGLIAYAEKRASEPNPGVYTLLDNKVPREIKFKLEPTGSDWLDLSAEAIEFRVKHEPREEEQLRFEVYDESRTRIFEMLSKPEWSGLYKLETGKIFNVSVYGPDGASVKVEISTLLFPSY